MLAVLLLVSCAVFPHGEVTLQLQGGGPIEGRWASGSVLPVRTTVDEGVVYPTLEILREGVELRRVVSTHAAFDLEGTGRFDVLATGRGGELLDAASIEVVEPSGHTLGLWVGGVGLVMPGMVFANQACVRVVPVPLDASDRPLSAVYPSIWAENPAVGLVDRQDDLLGVCVYEAGAYTVAVHGDLEAQIVLEAVDVADVVRIQIASVDREGGDLLHVVGWTSDGVPVLGLEAVWDDDGWYTATHDPESGDARACVGDLCATWSAR